MLTNRTKLSLCQFLGLFRPASLDILLEKYGSEVPLVSVGLRADPQTILREWAMAAENSTLMGVIGELARTSGTLRSEVQPRYRFDERWAELIGCLALDGYRVDGSTVALIEPSIEGAPAMADELERALAKSGLSTAAEIQRMIRSSIDCYVRAEPDYNGCLNASRVALQTLATSIAATFSSASSSSYHPEKWGSVMSFLRRQDVIGPREEEGLTGVFSLVSPGSHRPIGLSEQEYARFGRSLAITMTYFLVRRFNGFSGRK